MNRRLVPMPTKKSRSSKTPAAPVATIVPSGLKTWQTFAFLVVIAVLWHYLRGLLIVVGMVAGFFWCLNWLCHRFPRTMSWIVLIVEGLLSGRITTEPERRAAFPSRQHK